MASISSLLKSASSLRDQVATFQDSVAANDYANSAYTDEAYQTYKDYIQGRLDTYKDNTSISGQSKAFSLTKALDGATKNNISASITRENIQVLSGNATLQNKYDVISNQYVRAVNNGDMTLAQSLMSQAYSVSQQIQYQAQQASDASAALAKSNNSSSAKVAAQMADTAISSLKQLNKDLATVGNKTATKEIDKWMNTASDSFGGKTPIQAFANLGITLPKGAKPNAADLAGGVAQYAYQQYAIAAKAVDPYIQPGSNNTYEDKANAIVTGTTKIPVVGGKNVAYADLQAFSNAINSGAVGYNETTGGFGKLTAGNIPVPEGTTFNGYQYDSKGKSVQPILSNNGFLAASPELAIESHALGLNASSTKNLSQGAAAQVTSDSPDWLKKIAPVGSWLNVAMNNKGQLTFAATTTNGEPGNAVYTIVHDATGKRAPIETGSKGDIILGGEYGFNNASIRGQNGGTSQSQNSTGANSLLAPHLNLSSDFQGVNQVLSQAQQRQAQITASNAVAAKALLPTSLPPLPNIATTSPVAPPSITQAGRTSQIIPITPQVQSPTLNPQQPTIAPGVPRGINLQGAGPGSIRL